MKKIILLTLLFGFIYVPVIYCQTLYSLAPTWSNDDENALIAEYNYDSTSETLTLVNDTYAEIFGTIHSIAQNPVDGQVYIIAADGFFGGGTERVLHTYDIVNNIVGPQIGVISGVPGGGGGEGAQRLAFGSDGTLYASYRVPGGDSKIYIIDTITAEKTLLMPRTTIGGANGLAYDYDNDRLIISGENGTVSFYEIDITDGSTNLIFETDDYCTAQAMDYLGNGNLIVSGTYSCGDIYTVDLNTSTTNNLTFGDDGVTNNIWSLMLDTGSTSTPPPPVALDFFANPL